MLYSKGPVVCIGDFNAEILHFVFTYFIFMGNPPINSAPWTGQAVIELQGQGASTYGAMGL